MSAAGHLFKCVCCKESHDEDEATHDAQLGGPVCEECHRNLNWSQAYLKLAGITRPIDVNDINHSNYHRFKGDHKQA